MTYLDHGATSFPKPAAVKQAMMQALERCANPGRGGYPAAMEAASVVYSCREAAGELFHCLPEQVVLTGSCTHGLNMAIRTLAEPGDVVVISGFEHNAVVRPLYGLGIEPLVAGRQLFDPVEMLNAWEKALSKGVKAAVFTHVSNVFGYVLPLQELAALCRRYQVPFIVDAAQSAGSIPLDFQTLGAEFVAMPGHKGLLGPQGTGLLLCSRPPKPLLLGGTGGDSLRREMPPWLPDRGEAGTLNVPGAAGLAQGLHYLKQMGVEAIGRREQKQMRRCAQGLQALGVKVFTGTPQSGTLSFLARTDCEAAAEAFAKKGIALRAGLHCAPLAHESAGTLQRGTVRLSFGHNTTPIQTDRFLHAAAQLAKAGVL